MLIRDGCDATNKMMARTLSGQCLTAIDWNLSSLVENAVVLVDVLLVVIPDMLRRDSVYRYSCRVTATDSTLGCNGAFSNGLTACRPGAGVSNS